jgi:hypothetical protein
MLAAATLTDMDIIDGVGCSLVRFGVGEMDPRWIALLVESGLMG